MPFCFQYGPSLLPWFNGQAEPMKTRGGSDCNRLGEGKDQDALDPRHWFKFLNPISVLMAHYSVSETKVGLREWSHKRLQGPRKWHVSRLDQGDKSVCWCWTPVSNNQGVVGHKVHWRGHISIKSASAIWLQKCWHIVVRLSHFSKEARNVLFCLFSLLNCLAFNFCN